jgi:hypothetical protein
MSGACSTSGKGESESLNERDQLEDLAVDGKTTAKRYLMTNGVRTSSDVLL